MGAMVLKNVERDPSILVNRDNFAIQQRTGWQAFASVGDLRKLRGKVVATTRPNRYAMLVPGH